MRLPQLFVALCTAVPLAAQQDPAYAMYMWNMLTVNPGHAGTNDRMSATLLGRQQWVGMDGAPSTQALTVHSPLPSRTIALGAGVVRDNVGPLTSLRASADIAYRVRTGNKMRLALGLKAGMEWMQMNMTDVPDVEAGDPIFQQDTRSGARPNFGFGAYWWGKRGFIAFSVPRLLEYDALSTTASGQQLTGARQQRAYMLSAGRVFGLGDALKLQTWGMAKGTMHAPIAFDATLALVVRDKFWLGASSHGSGTLAGFLAYRFMDRIQVGYAYGASLGVLRSRNDGTHEVLLSYDVPLRGDRTLSPRYF